MKIFWNTAIRRLGGLARCVASRRPALWYCQSLNLLNFVGLQAELEDVEISTHVVGIRGAGEWHHAHLQGEAEDDLADGPAVSAVGAPPRSAARRGYTIRELIRC